MNSIKELFDNILDNQSFANVLGQGSYSIVWDIGGKAYKLTSEIEPNKAREIQKINNYLANLGVNVPYIFEVDVFDADAKETVLNIKSMMKNADKKKMYDLLKKYSQNFEQNGDKGNLVGIKQQKIDGKTCFDFDVYKVVRSTNNMHTKNNFTPPPILPQLEDELSTNLKTFLGTKPNAISKFIADGATILENDISVDNLLGNNFILSNGEFYYIDLGADQMADVICEKNLFNFTVENICRTVYSISNNLDQQLYQKQLELAQNICKAVEQNLDNDFIKNQFEEYMSKDNLYKKLVEHAYGNLSSDTKKDFDELYEKVCMNPKEYQ